MIEAIPIELVTITYTDINDSTVEFDLEAPNELGESLFVYGYEPVETFPNFRDDHYRLQDGERYFRFFAEYQYESHEMDLRGLLAAKSITLRTPPVYGDIVNYHQHEVFLDAESAQRGYFSGLVMGGGTYNIPNSGGNIRFIGRSALTWEDMLNEERWFQDSCDLEISSATVTTYIKKDIDTTDVPQTLELPPIGPDDNYINEGKPFDFELFLSRARIDPYEELPLIRYTPGAFWDYFRDFEVREEQYLKGRIENTDIAFTQQSFSFEVVYYDNNTTVVTVTGYFKIQDEENGDIYEIDVAATSSAESMEYSIWQDGQILFDWQDSSIFETSETGDFVAKARDSNGCRDEHEFTIS